MGLTDSQAELGTNCKKCCIHSYFKGHESFSKDVLRHGYAQRLVNLVVLVNLGNCVILVDLVDLVELVNLVIMLDLVILVKLLILVNLMIEF